MIPFVPTPARPLRCILVPLDGSALAEQALDVAASRARKTGATLHLVSVREPLPPLALPPDVPLPTNDLEDQAQAELQEYLETVASAARSTLPSAATTAILTGDAAAALCEYVEDQEVDLVIMTTHGRTGLSRLWLGSVADRMLRRLAIPVLLLHPSEEPQPTEFRRLVVALDGTIEQPILDAMLALGAQPGTTRCLLTRVVEPAVPVLSGLAARPARLPPDWNVKREIDARNYLVRVADPMARAGWNVDSQVLVGRGVAAQVLALAEAAGADCILVGTHGARGLERLMLGSVADKIVRGARVPVLVAPAGHVHDERRPVRAGEGFRAIEPACSPALT